MRAYQHRLRAAAGTPYLLVAHHYTRYLGDLSGGQAVGAALLRAYDEAAGGTAFYAFAGIPRRPRYREAYRARLDAFALTAAERERLVEEVRVAFRLNRALLRACEPGADETHVTSGPPISV